MAKVFLPLVATTCPIILTMWRLHPTSLVITSPHPQEMSIPPVARKRAHKAAFTPWSMKNNASVLYSMGPTPVSHFASRPWTAALTLRSTPFASCSAALRPPIFPSDHCHVELSHSYFSPWKNLLGLCILATAFSSALHNQTSLLISWLCSPSFSDNSNLKSGLMLPVIKLPLVKFVSRAPSSC